MEYQAISADCHVIEPAGTFVDRVPAKLRDRAPKIVPTDDGANGWQVEDAPATSFGLDSAAIWTYEEYQRGGLRHEDTARGAWDPKAHVEAMRKDGVDASVLYPGVGLRLYNMKDQELRQACMQAWNDWLAEFCSHDRARLIGPPLLPTEEDDIQVAVRELERNVKEHNVRTAQLNIFPWKRFWEPYYDPLWEAAQSMGIPLAFHRGVQRPFALGSQRDGPWMANQVMRDFSYTMPFADLIFGGVFDRFPDLKMVSSEGRIGWLPHFAVRADESYRRHRHWLKFKLKRLPSDYLKTNLYSTFIEDRLGILAREIIGTDTLMWSSDYPHSDSTWPNSQAQNEKQFEGVSPEDKRKMLAGNAVRLYRLD